MIYPVFAMMLLTTVVVLSMLARRIGAARTGQVKLRQYKLMDGPMPDELVAVSNHYRNLFEMPVLFYTVVLAYLALDVPATPLVLGLAWAYVALRALHTFIHLGYNHVGHRLAAFAGSNLVLLALWLLLLVKGV